MGETQRKKTGPKPRSENYLCQTGDFMREWYSRVQPQSGLSKEKLLPELNGLNGRNILRHMERQVPNAETFKEMRAKAIKNGWIRQGSLLSMMQPESLAEYRDRQKLEFEYEEQSFKFAQQESSFWTEEHADELEQKAAALLRQASEIRRYQSAVTNAFKIGGDSCHNFATVATLH